MLNILTPEEVSAVQMALQTQIEELEQVSKEYPLNKDGRETMADLLSKMKSALEKIQKASGHVVRMDPYRAGDEKEFLEDGKQGEE